jgi:hypothetical protein
MKKRALLLSAAALSIVLGALSACGDKPAEPGAASASPAATTQSKPATSGAAASSATATAAASAAPSASASASNDLPSQADFEDEAESDIGTDNFTDELGALEKEIDAK